MEGAAILVLQHIWSRWTKAARGALPGHQRPRPAPAYPLKAPLAGDGAGVTWLHEVRLLEADGFEPAQRTGWITPDDWAHQQPTHAANLRWTVMQDRAEISLLPPWDSLRRTAWPGHLPSPLVVLAPGDVVRIDWNARFAASAGGSNRAYFYEEHAFLLAVMEAPEPALFQQAVPRKHIDLRTRIY